MRGFQGIAAGLLIAVAAGAQANEAADKEIQYLLDYVADSGCTFTRNGSDHDSADAADHLRLKYRRGGRYARTADQFIDRLASESSWTGEIYTVTCKGSKVPSGEWLHRALDGYRETQSTAAN